MFPLELFTSVCSRGGAVGPHFSCMSCPLALARLWLLAPSGSPCGVLRGVESLACVLGCLRRASPRGARTASFSWAFGSYGGRLVLRGFCGGAIFLLSWLCPWLVAGRTFSCQLDCESGV